MNERTRKALEEAAADNLPTFETVEDLMADIAPWREHLTPEEAKRLDDIETEKLALRREHRRIFDRARKRADRS